MVGWPKDKDSAKALNKAFKEDKEDEKQNNK